MNKQSITDHINGHIEALKRALESTDDPKERKYIEEQISQYEAERAEGIIHPECLPFVKTE